jgi:hypothetical protein
MASTEAPASVTYSLITPSGFPILFTMRDDMVSGLQTKMETLEPSLIKKGYKPQERKFSQSKPPVDIVPDRLCPLCKNTLVRGITKDGKKYIKCSTQKYDFTTKSTLGCKFIEWEK